jgi:alanine transaminase
LQLALPKKALEKAESLGQCADVFYAFQLLENTGICIVPGSGFGQKPGTFHFRSVLLLLLTVVVAVIFIR